MIQSSTTNSRQCNYGCGTQIYWNASKKAFVEVETGNKHFCQARKASNTFPKRFMERSKTNRPTFTTGTGKPLLKHSNSIQVLKGSEQEVTKQYERLSDIVAELGGKIHGSQSHYINNSELRIIVYYEVPGTGAKQGRELVKSRVNQT